MIFGVDISEWQNVVGSNYEYPVFSVRVHNGYRLDRRFAANAAVIDRNPGVHVKVAYIVPVAGMNVEATVAAVRSELPPGWATMADEESGSGFDGPGNHSATLNALREACIAELHGGNRRMSGGYANGYDWATGWPVRNDAWRVVAGYSAHAPAFASGVIGWQFTDGEAKYSVPGGWPRGSRAIGNCDVNAWNFDSGEAFAAWLATGSTIVASGNVAKKLPEDKMQQFAGFNNAGPGKDQPIFVSDGQTVRHVGNMDDFNALCYLFNRAGLTDPHTGRERGYDASSINWNPGNLTHLGVYLGPDLPSTSPVQRGVDGFLARV